MKIETIEYAGITFLNLSTVPNKMYKEIEKMQYDDFLTINNDFFVKVYDYKFGNVGPRAGCALVKDQDVEKYYHYDGTL